jgi:hypothetical protein
MGGTTIETGLKKCCLRAVVMWVSWSERPDSVIRVGMSLYLWLKCHFTAVHRCSGVALWRNSFAQLHLAVTTTLQSNLLAPLCASRLWALQTLVTAMLHSLFHQDAPLGKYSLQALNTARLVLLMLSVRWCASRSTSTVVVSTAGIGGFVSKKRCDHRSWASSSMMKQESWGGGAMADSRM